MSKKQKRQVSRQYSTATGSNVDVIIEKPSGSSSRMVNADFNPDYTYVKKDLKVIGSLAATFFVILIVLSFIIK